MAASANGSPLLLPVLTASTSRPFSAMDTIDASSTINKSMSANSS